MRLPPQTGLGVDKDIVDFSRIIFSKFIFPAWKQTKKMRQRITPMAHQNKKIGK